MGTMRGRGKKKNKQRMKADTEKHQLETTAAREADGAWRNMIDCGEGEKSKRPFSTDEGIKKETEWTEVEAGGREEERRQRREELTNPCSGIFGVKPSRDREKREKTKGKNNDGG